jgi:hypothetical protein
VLGQTLWQRSATLLVAGSVVVRVGASYLNKDVAFCRRRTVVSLSDFQVMHERGGNKSSLADPLIQCFDGNKMVLAFVSRTGMDDYFRVSGSERRTLKQWNLVVESNRDAFAKIIAGKYERGDRSTYQGAGQTFPRVDVILADMERCGEKLRDDVLKVQTSFQ